MVVEWGGSTRSLMLRMVELMALLQSVHTSSPVMASVDPGTTEREITGSTYAMHDMNAIWPITVAALVVGPYWL